MSLFCNRPSFALRMMFLVVLLALLSRASYTSTIVVPAGGNLQQALNNAKPGDVILLEPGATYRGNFTLPARSDSSTEFITIRSAAPDRLLPASTQRITLSDVPRLARIQSPNEQPALATAPGAHHYKLLFLEFGANRGGIGDILTLGDGSDLQKLIEQVPHDLVVDRCYIHGDPAVGQKRCVALNSAKTTVTNSHISDCKTIGQDSQAVAGWNGPGPFTISNNYLEAAGDNVMFGGSDPAIPNLVPSDIVIHGNLISRPLSWRGSNWQVKNLLELKNARRVTITQNRFENNWQAAQTGFAILFTVRNQDGRCPWCAVDQVTFEDNVVRHSAGGIVILGLDDHQPGIVSQQAHTITIRHNLFDDIDSEKWGGNGYFVQILGEPRDITIDHNTIIQEHASGLVQVDGPPILGFVFTNNIGRHNDYGIIGTSHAPGMSTISAFFPASTIEGNVIADGDAARYPRGNRFPSTAEFRRQFVSYVRGDYRLVDGSSWRRAGTDREDLGPRWLTGTLLPLQR